MIKLVKFKYLPVLQFSIFLERKFGGKNPFLPDGFLPPGNGKNAGFWDLLYFMKFAMLPHVKGIYPV